MKYFPRHLLFLIIFVTFHGVAAAQIELPRLVSDGMVLQRDADVVIRGTSSPGQTIRMEFLGSHYQTETDAEGGWSFELRDLSPGGPYEILFTGPDSVRVRDVWIGDVWVGSGQSNMELPMYRAEPLYREEMEQVGNPPIRYFEVPKTYDFNTERNELEGGAWQPVNRDTIEGISALAYFFSRSIQETYDVPVGIILSALGGSPAEAWLSEEALKSFPDYYEEMQRFKKEDLITEIESDDRQRIGEWYRELNEKDPGLSSSGNWYQKELSEDGWASMELPGYWKDRGLEGLNGSVWFRKHLDLPERWQGRAARLELGRLVDADSVFVNGTFIGRTTYQYPPRWYQVPEGVLREGKNVIAVRVITESGNGGFVPDKPYELTAEGDTLDLKGAWHYRVGSEMEPLQGATAVRWKPGGLYNAMIHPLLGYSIKGVIWYQGESNADRPDDYRELMLTLIEQWQRDWNQPDLPFLFVQLANYMEPRTEPVESSWARLREAQLQTLEADHTAMAVAIDLGEWNDIHPLNKKDVGERLALAARHTAYGEEIPYSGPQFEAMEVERNRAVLSFSHREGGLVAKERGDHGPALHEFIIAGADRVFYRANATIEGGKVVVWSEEVDHPVAVRYAWADNPHKANLYNRAGLPASPFRTDGW